MQFEQGPVGPATYCQSGQHGVAFTGLKGVAISDAWPRADVEALDRLARWLPWPAVGRCGACRLAHGALEVVRSTRLGSRPARASPGPIMPPAALSVSSTSHTSKTVKPLSLIRKALPPQPKWTLDRGILAPCACCLQRVANQRGPPSFVSRAERLGVPERSEVSSVRAECVCARPRTTRSELARQSRTLTSRWRKALASGS